MLRTAALATLVLGILGTLGAGLTRGAAGALSCALGVAFVAAMFAVGMAGLRLVLRGGAHLAQAGAFAVFFLQMYVGLMLADVGRGAGWIDPSALAAGAIGATLVWQAGMVIGFGTARRLVFSPDDAGAPGTPASGAAGHVGIGRRAEEGGDDHSA